MAGVIHILANNANPAQCRVVFDIRLPGGFPASKDGQQPVISIDAAAPTSAGGVISALTEFGGPGNGRGFHYATLSQAVLNPAGRRIETMFNSPDGDTVETKGDTVLVVGYNLFDITQITTAMWAFAARTLTGTVGLTPGQIAIARNVAREITFTMILTGTRTKATGKAAGIVAGVYKAGAADYAGLNGSPAIVEVGTHGDYKVAVAASDFNIGNGILEFTHPQCDPTTIHFVTQV